MITASGVSPVRKPQPATVAVIAAVDPISSARSPKRFSRYVVAGLIAMLPTNTNSTTAPERTGLQPNASWNISVSRNGTAPTTIQYSEPPTQ